MRLLSEEQPIVDELCVIYKVLTVSSSRNGGSEKTLRVCEIRTLCKSEEFVYWGDAEKNFVQPFNPGEKLYWEYCPT
jgi:hypothetical protein